MMEKFIGKKEKWTNKGNDKQRVAVFLIHVQYNKSLPSCVPSFKIVLEKYVTEMFSYALHRREREMEKQIIRKRRQNK